VASYALARGIPAEEERVEVEPFPIVSAAAPDPAELGALHE
jgi:hypothetical protein